MFHGEGRAGKQGERKKKMYTRRSAGVHQFRFIAVKVSFRAVAKVLFVVKLLFIAARACFIAVAKVIFAVRLLARALRDDVVR